MAIISPVSSFESEEIDHVEMAVTGKDHARRGEEGALYRANLDGQDLWVKRWYRSHEVGYSINPDLGGAALSPFFARMKSVEYEIIHSLFPAETIDMVGSYDQRCIEDEDGKGLDAFGIFAGRPTTVSKNVTGDSELMAKYDAIIVPAQKMTVEYRDANIRSGRGNPDAMDPFFVTWRREVNRMVRDLIGPEVTFPHIHAKGQADYLRQVAENARKIKARSPKNVIPEMISVGIYPIHPEVNFVPGNSKTHERPPYGTFLELKIFNPEVLNKKCKEIFANNPEGLKEMMGKMQNREILSKLHRLFHRVVFETQYPSNDRYKYGNEFNTAVADYLYRLYMDLTTNIIDLNMFDKECQQLPQKIAGVFMKARGERDLVEMVRRLAE